jgi:predicted exporter
MAAFLPPGRTPAAALLFRQLQTGAATSLILIGIEGDDAPVLARASANVTAALRRSGRFAFVSNGSDSFGDAERDFLFKHRYLLSPATTADAFTVPALHQSLETLLQGLASSASPLLKQFGFADPIGAFLAVVRAWIGESHAQERLGVWFSPDGKRALILAKSKAAGLDFAAQQPVVDAITAAFAQGDAGHAHLLVSGPAIFALDASNAIRRDAERVTVVSALLILAFLLWQYRSPVIVAAIAIPLGLSLIAGAVAVELAFGFVHAITLGFGVTMLGVTVDYPILLASLRRPEEAAPDAIRRIAPTLLLAAASAALGLTGMLFSSFPGLTQLGLFAITGVAVAAAATRWLLPPLLAAATARSPASWPLLAHGVARLRAHRAWAALPILIAALFLAWRGGPHWESDLANLSPVPAAQRDLDGELRRQIGAPDVRHLIVVSGETAEGVLEREEALTPMLQRLKQRGAIADVEMASRFLPSERLQLDRREALPEPPLLAARLAEAAAGMPFRAGVFQPFIDDIAATRATAPVMRGDIASPLIASRIDASLFADDGTWRGLIALIDVRNPTMISRAVAAQDDPRLTYIDIKATTDAVASAYTGEATKWVAGGALAVVLALALVVRDLRRVARLLAPIAGAVIVTLAILDALGVALTLFDLVALLLMVGVSIDYTLFANRPEHSSGDGERTLRALVNCNVTTLLTFGFLAFCQTPILAGIGATVAVGVLSALIFSLVFAAPPGAGA